MIIGVTGGIGSGKTTFSKALEEKGAYLIDADQIVRTLYTVSYTHLTLPTTPYV